ncbi:MAG TPA: hypothetical protein VHE80_07990 [Acidimicrobiales bacterium]|nr:hypothetical protein [Acidimicrobiales bacterium]
MARQRPARRPARRPERRPPPARQGAVSESGPLARFHALAVRPQVVGPHARLGMVWAAVTFVALVAGAAWLAVWMALHAGLAALQAAHTWRRRERYPASGLAGVGAAVVVVGAAAGPVPAAAAAGVVVVAIFLNGLVPGGRHTDPLATALITLAVAAAAAGPVLLRVEEGFLPAMVLFTYAGVHDASAYVVGSGASTNWEGPAAGMASIGAVTLAVAAVLVPPFRGASPVLLGALAAVLAPLGPYMGSLLVRDGHARVPALRRLDSLLLLGPLWSLVAALLLR